MEKRSARPSLGLLVWLVLILIVGVVFLAQRETILSVIEATGLREILARRFRPDAPELVVDVPPSPSESTDTDPSTTTVQRVAPTHEHEPLSLPPAEAPRDPDESLPDNPPTEETVLDLSTADQTRTASVYFIEVRDDGTIRPAAVQRTISFQDSPLTRTIETLLEGLSVDELNSGLLNLIPEGSRLLGIAVRGGVAYINFSDAFQFNRLGVEGAVAQLKQVVFSATEYATVEAVQFLIEGRQVDYLGGDGVFIGSPLNRDSFS